MARFPNLFVVTYGRSGSTLLQGLLNTLPGYLIRGENGDLVPRLSQFVTAQHKDPSWENLAAGATRPTNSWYGCEFLSNTAYHKAAARFVTDLLLGDRDPAGIRCLGFKEIRYPPADLHRKLATLLRMFPDAAFVFNSRASVEVVRSQQLGGFSRLDEIPDIAVLDTMFEDYARAHDNAVCVRYEDVVELGGSFRAMIDFLGERFDRPVLAAQLARLHSAYHDVVGAIFSHFPYFVKPNQQLETIDFFRLDGLSRRGDVCSCGGLLLPRPPHADWIAALATPGQSRNAPTTEIRINQPSPQIGIQLQREDAAHIRFSVKFRLAGPGPYELRLNTGQTIATLVHLDELPDPA